ncbi:MAG: PAS domain S-box protein, partial [Planctomycetota bacterium]
MAPIPRKTGIDVVGNVPWGTHFCQFYQTKDDLLDILVPYFKTGLESNEFCMWVTCEPLSSEEARDALTEEVNNLDEYIAKGQIEILDYTQWYTKSGRFDAEHVLAGWVEKERQALKNGFEGLRLTGNTFWLEQKDWQDFADYEAEINRVIGNYRMLAICTYSLDRCTPSEIIDVVSNHEFALIRREHNWEIIESAKHTETLEALRESEEKFRNLAEQSPNMIFINKSGRIVYTNERCEKVMGYHREELCSADFDFLTLIAEEHRESTKANFRTHMGGLEVPPFEYTIVTRDGTRIEAILTTKLIQYEGQRAILGIVTDITKHKEAETQLKDSELKLKTIIENAPIGIYLNDLEGKFLYGNENAERIIGRSKDEFIGRSFLELDILGPEGVEKAKILLGLNREGKQTGPDEFILNRKDGAQRTVEVSTVVIDFEGTKAVLGMVRDVTEHRQAEHGLRAQKEFTETALNAQTDTFFVFEAATGKAVRWNEAFKKASGYSHEEIRLMKAPDSYYSQEDLTKARAVTEAILNGAAASVELSLITRDGRSIPTEYTASLIRDNEGSPKYIIAVGRDITERREAEEALRESEERLKEAQRIGGIGDWQFDVEKQEINWSDEVYRLFGRDPAEGPPTYEQNMAYYYPEDSQKLQQQIRRAVEYGDEFDSDYHLKLPSGRSVYQRGVIRVSKDENGRVTKLHGTVQDITERRQAAEALRESEEKYRAIFEQAADSIVLVDGETGRFVDFNNKACENLGYSREEFARLNIADIDVCESEQRVLQHAKKVVTEGADTFETRMRTKGGEIRDVLVNARVISLRGKMFISSVWRDVTEQKKAQEQVESLAKFPSEDPNPVLRISEDCTLVYANEPSAPVLETWQCRVGERLPQTCVERVYQAVNSHKVLTFEFECKNGRIFFVTLAPAADGTYANAYGVDITERKQAEEALRRSERQLQIRNQINSIFLTCADEETYAKVLTLVLETLESKYGTFGYFDDSGQFVVPAMTRDIYWEKCNVPEKDIIFERGQFSGIWGRAVKERKTLYSNSGPFSTPAGHVPIENTMVTPIIYKDELISAIHIANKPGGYDEKDKALLEMMADYIAPVLYARLQTDRHEKERAQAEESLRKSEAALAEAQRIARIGNWEWDVQSGKASWSDEVFSIFGVQPQEPSYELVKALTHPDDTEYWERSVKEALYENKDFKIDYRAVRPDGCVVWIHNEAEIARDERGNPLKMFGTSQDVTERKQAEQALRESEEKFRNLAEQSPNMIFINSGGTIAYANSRCEEAMGYTKEEFYSPGFDFLSIIVPESRDLIRESYRRHLNGEDVAPVEYALATKTGQRIDAILATKLIQYEGEDAILGTVTDITERKRTEEALKLHELRLEALLQLNKMTEASGQDILAFLREEMTEVTQSQVAFVGFISEDESVMSIDNWSKETMAQCAVVGKPMHFPVE